MRSALLRELLGTDCRWISWARSATAPNLMSDKRVVRITIDRVREQDTEIGKIIVLTDITDRRVAEYAIADSGKAGGHRQTRACHRA